MFLVTKQTGDEGKEVSTVYFNEATDIEKEYYLAVSNGPCHLQAGYYCLHRRWSGY